MILCGSEKADTEGLRNGPRNFPGGPAINRPPSNTECAGVIPGQGAEIPHATQRGHRRKEVGPGKDREAWSTAVPGVSDGQPESTAGHW